MNRHFEDLMLGSLELFCVAAEQRGFTAAANAAGVTPAAVSRTVARLEERLGVRLFLRTTRQIRLSEAGQAYYEQCRQALNQLLEAEREVSGQQVTPGGLLRISAPTTYGHHRLLPLLPEFRARYPEIRVEVHVSNRNIDFAAEGYDLAVRVRAPTDSTLIARHLEDAELVLVAAPDYLRRHGEPQSLDDLRAHECIQFELPSSGRTIPWLFRRDGQDIEMLTSGGYACSDDVLAGVTLARHGAGIFQAYRFVVEEDLRQGRLVDVLKPFGGRSRPYNLLYPQLRFVPLRVRTFVDFLLSYRSGGTAAPARPVL
jgi:DNA-binding transcriptional LysR family regulator